MNWANDYDSKAIHTYMANVQDPEKVNAFLGSIDDLQRLAISGEFSKSMPRIGEVDFISGGSPCPGFSRLTNDKTTVKQRKNQSMVASFGSAVDLYRPKYGLLENVPGIVNSNVNREHDVFSQLVCAIVGLGYQTQFFILDASSFGSPQRRTRAFLVFAATGYQLPAKPSLTHSHLPSTKALRLGVLPTGEPMAQRELSQAAPLKFVTAREATADLPPINDGKPDICVPFPDHRVSLGMTRCGNTRIRLIPTQPWGMNFLQAWFGVGRDRAPGAGVITRAERAFFPADGEYSPTQDGKPIKTFKRVTELLASKAYGRVMPHRFMDTVATTPNPRDRKNGRTLHWREDRILSVMEARRAQGLLDHEVLLGSPATQYKIVGNSVAREVALALGFVIREAWANSLGGSGGPDGGLRDEPAGMSVDKDADDMATPTTEGPTMIVDDSSLSSELALMPVSSRDSSTLPSSLSTPGRTSEVASIASWPQKRRCSFVVEIKAPKRCRGE